MGTFKEAENRIINGVYVCKKCKSKFRTTIGKVLASKAVCRKCKTNKIRIKRARAKK